MFNEQLQTLIKEKIPAQNRTDNELAASGDFAPGENSVGKLRIRVGWTKEGCRDFRLELQALSCPSTPKKSMGKKSQRLSGPV